MPAKENFNSRFALGFGNYNNLILDYGSSVSLDKRQNVDWFIFYDGLLKNINNSFVDTKQSNLNLNISHQFSTNKKEILFLKLISGNTDNPFMDSHQLLKTIIYSQTLIPFKRLTYFQLLQIGNGMIE